MDPQEDGHPLRVHLQSLARQRDPEARWRLLNQPRLSPHVAHLWTWFWEIARDRPSTGFGPGKLTREVIHRWEFDRGSRLQDWERRAILDLDNAYLATVGAAQKPSK